MEKELPDLPKKDKIDIKLSKIKRRLFKHVWPIRIFLIALSLALFSLLFFVGSIFFRGPKVNYFSLARNFLFPDTKKIASIDERTNVLIMGKGGANHEAPDLTDTMIMASVALEGSQVTTVSLPRDIWIAELRAKLNSVYYWGNKKEEGGGIILAKSVVEKIVGQPIHYGLVINFEGFTKVVDALGGVVVNVPQSFVDEKYPIAGKENDLCDEDPEYKCRYETIYFREGETLMDGETALKFVRSRNSEGDVGTDLSRGERQQILLSAIKNKVLSFNTLLSPKKITALFDALSETVETDLGPNEAAILARKLFDSKETTPHVLGEDFLENPPISSRYDNLYVFVPRDETWEKIHQWVNGLLND